MNRLDEILGDCDGLLAAPPETISQRIHDEIYLYMGVCGVHDVKALRNAAEEVCDDVYEGISDRERTEIVSEAINHCISSSF